jgi:hypothetical protein
MNPRNSAKFHANRGPCGHVDNRYFPRHGYAGSMPTHWDQRSIISARTKRDGRGHGHDGVVNTARRGSEGYSRRRRSPQLHRDRLGDRGSAVGDWAYADSKVLNM